MLLWQAKSLMHCASQNASYYKYYVATRLPEAEDQTYGESLFQGLLSSDVMEDNGTGQRILSGNKNRQSKHKHALTVSTILSMVEKDGGLTLSVWLRRMQVLSIFWQEPSRIINQCCD